MSSPSSNKITVKKDELKLLKKNHKKEIAIEKKIMRENKKHNKRLLRLNEGNIYLLASLLFVAGILTYVVSYILSQNLDIYREYIKGVIDDISKVLITMSLGTCLLEWFGFVEYIRKRIADVITKDDYIKTLSKDRKIDLKERIEQELFYQNSYVDKNSLLSVVQNEIYPMINEYYYKEYVTHVNCRMENGKIVKTISRRIVVSKNSNEKIEVPVSNFFSPLVKASSLDEAKKAINLQKVLIAIGDHKSVDKTKEFSFDCYELDVDDAYKYEFKLKAPELYLEEEDIIINIEIESIVELDDKVYIQRVDRPCKDFTIHFHYSKDFHIDGNGFGFMTQKHFNKIIPTNIDGCFVIRFTDWLLPGDGVCFYLDS